MDRELTHNGAKVPELTPEKRLEIVKGLDNFSDQLKFREVQLLQYEITLRAREKELREMAKMVCILADTTYGQLYNLRETAQKILLGPGEEEAEKDPRGHPYCDNCKADPMHTGFCNCNCHRGGEACL